MNDNRPIPEEILRVVEQILKLCSRESNICPFCQTTVTSMIQIGRGMYAAPCGCRIAQGFLNEAWKDGTEIEYRSVW